MKRSTDRILTTHVGSLPRGDALTPLLLARDKGEPYDAAAFDTLVQAAVCEAVTAQIEENGLAYEAAFAQLYVMFSTKSLVSAERAGLINGVDPDTFNYSIAAEDLTPLKARILLMLALATTDDAAEIQRMFTEY